MKSNGKILLLMTFKRKNILWQSEIEEEKLWKYVIYLFISF